MFLISILVLIIKDTYKLLHNFSLWPENLKRNFNDKIVVEVEKASS